MLMAMDGGGASFAIGGKVLKFEPETVAQTVAQFDQIRALMLECLNTETQTLTGSPAGQDEVSKAAQSNLAASVANMHEAVSSARDKMFSVSDTVRANAAAYGANDLLPPNG